MRPLIGALVSIVFPLVPLVAIWAIVRHGPVRNRWWRGERPLGFAAFVGGIAFVLGFVGPMVITPESNQGPLLGIFITGPVGFAVGWLWGLLRTRSRPRVS